VRELWSADGADAVRPPGVRAADVRSADCYLVYLAPRLTGATQREVAAPDER
jgi:hypothetical protein